MEKGQKKSTYPRQEEVLNLNIYTDSLPRFEVVCNSFGFVKKPSDAFTFGRIHGELKQNKVEKLTIQEILGRFTEGRCLKLGKFRPQGYTVAEASELRELQRMDSHLYGIRKREIEKDKKLELVATRLLVLDIDDRKGLTDPREVFAYSGALAMYFSFSHGTVSDVFQAKQNAYRLIYVLAEPVSDNDFLKHIQKFLAEDLYKAFPALRPVVGVGKGNCGIDIRGAEFFFGTNHPETYVNEEAEKLDTLPYEASWKKEREQLALAQAASQERRLIAVGNGIADQEIMEMALFLGDTNKTGLIAGYDQWRTIAIGLWNSAQLGEIQEETALEVLRILDGCAQSDHIYEGFKMPLGNAARPATVASFIDLAKRGGFKRSFTSRYAWEAPEIEPDIKTGVIPYGRYISVNDMRAILMDAARRILVVSDTNTGKTKATIAACKAYLQEHPKAFVYLALPTRALASQVANHSGLGRPLQDDKQAFQFVRRALDDDSRFLCGTYDKTKKVLKALPAGHELIVIADEGHKEVSDYSYRHTAINALFSITESARVRKFIALTGTPQEIDLSHYDKRYLMQPEESREIARELLFIEYNKASGYTQIIAEVIKKEIGQGAKALVYVNSKKEIEFIRGVLKKVGIKAVAVTSDNRESPTYSALMDAGTIPDDVQAVLATNVIADGINIENAPGWVCVIAPHYSAAPFFNTALIKQASNRFRNTYKRLILPLFIKGDLEKERQQETAYNLESKYRYLFAEAKEIRVLIAAEFGDCPALYAPSVAERLAGLFDTSLAADFDFPRAIREDENRKNGLPFDADVVARFDEIKKRRLTVNERALRQKASQKQEKYYAYFPYAFKKAVVSIIGIETVKTVAWTEYLESKDLTIADELDRLKAQAKLDEADKMAALPEILTESLFDKLQAEYYVSGRLNQETELCRCTKAALHPNHFSTLKSVIGFLPHDQAIKELARIKKKAQINELLNSLTAYGTLQAFKGADAAGKKSETQRILAKLGQAFSDAGAITKTERDALLDAVAKGERRGSKSKEAVTSTFKLFFVQTESKSERIGGKVERVGNYKILDLNHLAAQHDFSESEMLGIYDRMQYNSKFKRID